MALRESSPHAAPKSAGVALLTGTLAVGVLDLLDAFIFFGLRGARPIRILQSIAAGLLGRASFTGGWPTALLGLALHFFIAFCVVLVLILAARRLPFLTRHWFLTGLVYGIGVYVVMNFVVIPLSAAGGGASPSGAVRANGLLIHMFGVGLPASLAARAVTSPRRRSP
jgi:hypothetical protein